MGWPGYLSAPRLATAALGQRIWDGCSATTVRTAVEVLKGTDPAGYQRYMTFRRKRPLYQGWISAAERRDSVPGERQRTWLERRGARPVARQADDTGTKCPGRAFTASTRPGSSPPAFPSREDHLRFESSRGTSQVRTP